MAHRKRRADELTSAARSVRQRTAAGALLAKSAPPSYDAEASLMAVRQQLGQLEEQVQALQGYVRGAKRGAEVPPVLRRALQANMGGRAVSFRDFLSQDAGQDGEDAATREALATVASHAMLGGESLHCEEQRFGSKRQLTLSGGLADFSFRVTLITEAEVVESLDVSVNGGVLAELRPLLEMAKRERNPPLLLRGLLQYASMHAQRTESFLDMERRFGEIVRFSRGPRGSNVLHFCPAGDVHTRQDDPSSLRMDLTWTCKFNSDGVMHASVALMPHASAATHAKHASFLQSVPSNFQSLVRLRGAPAAVEAVARSLWSARQSAAPATSA